MEPPPSIKDRRVRFLVNPSSGGGRVRRHLAALTARAEAESAELEISEDAADFLHRAQRAVQEGVRRLVIAGGDGTMQLTAGRLAGTGCELALLPIGRGNDLANSLKIPKAFEEALDLAVNGDARPIDLGKAGDHWFHCYGGAGLDSATSKTADGHPRWWPDSLTYTIAVVRTLIGFRPPVATVEWDGGRFKGRVMFVTACNAPQLGGGMRLAPEASLSDGKLDLVIVREISRRELLKIFPRVFKGTHVGHPAISIERVRWVRMSFEPGQLLACDGELRGEVGERPLHVELHQSVLRVVTP